jgi:hypothetical protein
VSAAAPLLQIDRALMPTVHPDMGEGPMGYRVTLSTLPFLLHPLEGRIKDRLGDTVYAGRSIQLDNTLTQDSDLSYIDVISTLSSPIYPWVVPSLMMPIVEEWNGGDSGSANFWTLRRARPVREFIPAPQPHIRAMLRGWFTGEALGLITIEGGKVRIVHDADGDSPRFVPFPYPTLELPEDRNGLDMVVTLLESLALVMPEVARTNNITPFRPYNALRNLGMSVPRSGKVLAYESLNPILRAWIETGQVASRTVTGAKAVDGLDVLPDAAQRRQAVIDRFEAIRADLNQQYREYLRVTREKPRLLSDAPLWPGLKGEIDVALYALIRTLKLGGERE